MKKIAYLLLTLVTSLTASAQNVTAKWEFSDADNLSSVALTGDDAYTSLLTTNVTTGSQWATIGTLTTSGADTGYDAVTYSPAFTTFTPSEKASVATEGHDIKFTITPATGHKFKVNKISFDCVMLGTDGAAVSAKLVGGSTSETLSGIIMLRNKITASNSIGYGHNEFTISDMIVDGEAVTLTIYFYNMNGTNTTSPKSAGLRNVQIDGEVDEEVYDVSHYLSAFSFNAEQSTGTSNIDIIDNIKSLKNGENYTLPTKLYSTPTDFATTLQSALTDGYTASVNYDENTRQATVNILKDDVQVFTFTVTFAITSHKNKGVATPLKRGLMAIYQSSGNLVSWRSRATDTRNYKFKLYRGSSAASQTTTLNSGNYIMGKTNFIDKTTGFGTGSYYKLEVYDDNDNLIETEVSGATWSNQTKYITLSGGAPTDPTSAGATYTPNDASYCDMDGDGEYEIILKWAPSNEKDAASSGTTSPAFYGCYKLDGTRLWMINTGPNMFNSAHTTPFIAWDLEGDGFGEFMVKTAPGCIDGEGNYVLIDSDGDGILDDPTVSLKNGKGKQESGPEYITVFDGTTGAELKTIPYHTKYADETTTFWGDPDFNRCERYLAAIAWLDGEDSNPSAIFARGYYFGCKIGAYDWDGDNLTLRWLHRGESATKGTVTYADGSITNLTSTVYGEGAHWVSVGDVDGDGKQEITYGSGALKPDGTTLYRTGLGHGDALHLGEFMPEHDGLEVFMAHEKGNFGIDLRDAVTGEILTRRTATEDTGRGLIAHYNPEVAESYFQDSYDGNVLYTAAGEVVTESASHGGGAGQNNRIYWNGDLADDWFDKSILETYNYSTKTFDRMQVNGTSYTTGTLNNGTKYNPCVLGDLLGDWREEIVTWATTSDGDYQLVINATNYETSYIVPHLMDNYAYRAQVINQNCAYNQPPHLNYDLRDSKIVKPATIQYETINGTYPYWGTMYNLYSVIVPEGTVAYAITNRTTNGTDTLKLSKFVTGAIIPAERGVIFNSTSDSPEFVPTTRTSSRTISTSYSGGQYCDMHVDTQTATKKIYKFGVGDRGIGFYLADNQDIEGGTAYATFGTTAYPAAASYVIDEYLNAGYKTTGIEIVNQDESTATDDAVYNIQGVRLSQQPQQGVYIQGGKKFVK